MNRSNISTMDLSREIVFAIWRKFIQIDAIYSFFSLNKRFDRLVNDALCTPSIELTRLNLNLFKVSSSSQIQQNVIFSTFDIGRT